MQLLDIDDPLENKPEISFEHAIGIDLGTTNSVCAYCHNDAIKLIKYEGEKLIPSVVSFKDDEIIVGKQIDEDNTISFESVKRLMGKGIEDLGDDYERFKGIIDHSQDNTHIIHLKHGNQTITPIELSSKILAKIKELALTEKQLRAVKRWMQDKIKDTYINLNSDITYCDFVYNWKKE